MADRSLKAAETTLDLLSTQPLSGNSVAARKSALHGMRRFPVSSGFENILLFYVPMDDGVDLVRVVHGNRELAQRLSEG